MPEFSSIKITLHHFHFDNNEGESGICYGMIIVCKLMVQLDFLADFKRQVLQWDGETVPIKELITMIGQTDITSYEMREVAIKTAESVSTSKATDRLVKILDSTYTKSDLEQVSNNSIHMKS